MGRSKLWIGLGVLVFAAGYFVLDVRQRARIDRGVKRHRTDFTVYQYAARALNAREDPYEARNPRGYRYVYPPLLAVLLMPIADWEPPNAALVFYLLSAACLLYALWALARLRPGTGPPVGIPALLVAGVTCLGFAHQCFERGQVVPVLLALHVAALVALLRGRVGWAVFWLALGGALRLTPLLAAGAIGVAVLASWGRTDCFRPVRYGVGLLAGLVLGFVVIPVLALGVDGARDATMRWHEVTRSVYAQNVDLQAAYRINEWRYKNQAPRRVYGTWTGWLTGAPFEGEKPLLEKGPASIVSAAGTGTGLALIALALLLGATALRSEDPRIVAAAFAAITLLPVLITRYAWPTHYLLALPAVALAAAPWWGGAPMQRTRWILLAGAVSFYAAGVRPLAFLGEAGCLMLACALFLAAFLGRSRRSGARPETP